MFGSEMLTWPQDGHGIKVYDLEYCRVLLQVLLQYGRPESLHFVRVVDALQLYTRAGGGWPLHSLCTDRMNTVQIHRRPLLRKTVQAGQVSDRTDMPFFVPTNQSARLLPDCIDLK